MLEHSQSDENVAQSAEVRANQITLLTKHGRPDVEAQFDLVEDKLVSNSEDCQMSNAWLCVHRCVMGDHLLPDLRSDL